VIEPEEDMPNYKLNTYSQIVGLLKAQGTQIGEFNQSSFREDVGKRITQEGTFVKSSVGGKSLGNGYCAGVCLDWARRVLLSTKALDERRLTYGYSTIKGGQGTKGRTLQQSQDRAFQTVGRMGQAWVQTGNMNWSAPSGSSVFTVGDTEWSSKAATLDNAFDSARGEDSRGLSNKRFSSLVLLGSKSSTYGSAGAWMGALLSSGVKAGGVTNVGFRRVGQSGHRVAIWQRKTAKTDTDSFYFFDPNFGVFSYNQDGLQTALQILFWRDSDDTPYYEECASSNAQEMSYLIFGPPNVVNALPSSAPVVTSTPSVTSSGPTNSSPTSPSIPSTSVVNSTPPITSSGPTNSSPTPPSIPPTSVGTSTPSVTSSGSTNAYGSPPMSLPNPGVMTTSVSTPNSQTGPSTSSGLKGELQKALGDTSKQMPTFAGQNVQGGYVKITYKLSNEIKKANLTTSQVVLYDGKGYAIAKSHLEQLIGMC
jgi:hypothetical protein